MGLIQNGYRDAHGCLMFAGATVSNGTYPAALHFNMHQPGRMRNLTAGEGITDETTSVPVGSRPPDCWLMAQKSGGMASTGIRVSGTCSVSNGNLAGGLNAEASIEGLGGIDSAAMGLIMSAVAALSGSGSATASMVGSIAAEANITGTSTMTAPLGAIAGAEAALQGTGGVCCSESRAIGSMSCDIAPATQVTAEVIANAVWRYER